MRKTLVLNAVGLTPRLVSPQHTPRIDAFLRAGRRATVGPVVPAVTCTVQSTYLTGTWPAEHGIVGNGWYDRADAEIQFWKQSNALVQRPKVWETARQRDPSFTCANICWWYAMYSAADYTVTPRPMYLADGRKLPDCWTHPPDLRHQLQRELGQFPLFQFWGPATTIRSTDWIARAAISVDQKYDPTLTLVYLPHLDYVLQKVGPRTKNDDSISDNLSPRAGTERGAASDASRDHDPLAHDLKELDDVIGTLLDHFGARGARIVLLSEYGITPVSRPVHPNRVLREAGLLTIRDELGRELLDPGESSAFAVADHQVAHVYVNDPARLEQVRGLLEKTPGVARVLDAAGKRELHLDHPRAGDLVLLADADAWFTYYYWLDDARAPDYARTVDIHRKPGYDPVELFLDPAIKNPKLRIGATLLKRKLGFRAMMDVIPLDATLVRGSHGLPPRDPADAPILATSDPALLNTDDLDPTSVRDLILRHVFE